MGLFDGPALKFANEFRAYLDGRIEFLRQNAHAAQSKGDTYTALCDTIAAATIEEISNALKAITEK